MKKLSLSFIVAFLFSTQVYAWPTFDIDSFLGLKDTPDTYLGDGGKCAVVNGSETGIEFSNCAGVGGGDSLTVDGGAVVDPDFASTGQIDFVNTANTITANINDNSILEADLKAVDAASDEECLTFETTTGDFEWQACGSGSGDVVGPASATDNALVRFDSTTGKLIQDSGAILSDANALSGVATLDTGQGANELYDMDQNVLTTSAPTFAGATLTGDLELGNTPQSIDGGTQGLAFDPDNDGTNEATIDTTGKISADGGFTAGAGADPSLTFDVVTAGDTDFWAGVQDDAGGDDDDSFQIGTGTTVGSNTRLTLDKDGNVTTYYQSDLRFADADGSHYVGFQSDPTVASSILWTLPDADSSGCFKSDGLGVMSIGACGGGSITGTDTHVTFFDGADNPAGDAGFTYNKTTDSATLVGDLTLNGHDLVLGTTSAGVTLTDDGDGQLTIAAKGDGSQENLTLNLDDASNQGVFGTSTGLNQLTLGADGSGISLGIANDVWLIFGISGVNAQMAWESTNTVDDFQIGVRVGSNSTGGFMSLMERADMGAANRSPAAFATHPTFRVYSADAASDSNGYIQLYHDETNGYVDVGSGVVNVLDATTVDGKIIGNASIDVKNGATSSGVLAIYEDSDDGSNFASFQVPALAANTVYTLPSNDGDASQFLQTDGNGVLTWATSAGSGDITDVGDCANGACFTGASGTLLQSNTDLIMELDNNNDGTESFQVKDGADTMVAEIAESGVINTLVGIDAIGAVDMDYGSADVTDHAFITDGTGDAEVVLPDQSISSTEILNDTITTSDLNATLTFSDGDLLDFGTNISSATEGILIPAHATSCASATAEGQVCWEEDADNLWIGDGAAAKQMNTGGSKPPREYYWPASALLPLEHGADSIPPIDKNAGTNVDILTRLFDSGTDECVSGTLLVPSDVNTSGTVTLRTKGFASTASCAGGSCEIIMDFRHVDRDDAETFDATLTTVADGACTISSTANTLTECTWTETITNLSWEASDTIEFEVCRDANNASDDLAGDFEMLDFSVEIPRA